MARIEITATLANDYAYSAPKYAGYGYETRHIYTFKCEDGSVYVWKTASFIGFDVPAADGLGYMTDAKGRAWDFVHINPGDVIRLSATVKGESEYNGQPQTVLTRVKVLERTFKAKTPEEIAAEKKALMEARKAAQINSLRDGDFVWTRMPYKQYKEHYSDCETIEDSYTREHGKSYIDVIIRDGRLKNSGVRGRRYSGYEFYIVEDGKEYRECYRAVSEETALRRLHKEYPNATEVTPGTICEYGNYHRYF